MWHVTEREGAQAFQDFLNTITGVEFEIYDTVASGSIFTVIYYETV